MFKKIISAMLCSALVFTSSAAAASEYDIMPISLDDEYAVMPISVEEEAPEENTVPDMKSALTAVKSRISIPDDAEFNYYTYTNELGNVFTFDWNYEVDGENSFISVECSEDGFIYSYYASSSNVVTDYKRLPNLDYSKAKAAATAMLKKLMPAGYSAYKLNEENVIDYAEYYSFTFQGYKNNVVVSDAYAQIEVNGVTGEVSGYYAKPIRSDVEYADASAVIGNAAAGEAFASLSETKLYYTDIYKDSERTTRPVYSVSRVTVDALTGEEADLYEYKGFTSSSSNATMDKAEMEEAAGEAGNKVSFSDAELEAIEGLSGYLTKEDVEKKVRGYKYFDLDEFKLVNASMRQYDDEYRWNLSFMKAFDRENEETANFEDIYAEFTLNAKTGELYNFNMFDYNAKEPKNIEYYAKKAESEVEKIMDEFVPESVRSKIRLVDNKYNSDPGIRYMNFEYERVNEGIPYSANSVSVRYDLYTGKVCYYRINWDDSVSFPSLHKAIDDAAAKKTVVDEYGFNLFYTPVKDEHRNTISYALVYELDGTNTMVDALKSEIIERYSYDNGSSDTSKIDGHWAEEYIKKLYSVNVHFNEDGIGAVNPDADVTDTELLYMLASARRRFYEPYPILKENYDAFVSALVKYHIADEKPVLKGEEIEALDAIVYALDSFKYGDVAKYSELFKTEGFEDIDADKLGYAAIATAMDIVHGDLDADSMTYGEAAYMVYALLSRMQ